MCRGSIGRQFRGIFRKICVSYAARKGAFNSWLKRRANPVCCSRVCYWTSSVRLWHWLRVNDFMFFKDEKVFHVEWSNIRSRQCQLKREIAAERLLCCRPTLSKSPMVSNCRLKAGLFGAVLCWTWRESGRPLLPWSLLKQQMLPVMCRIAGDVRPHTGHVRLSSSCSSRHRTSSRQICGRQTVLIWTWLQNLGFNAGAC